MLLSREIRFALVPPDRVPVGKPANSWAGWPSSNLVVPNLVLRCVIEGTPDPVTGYLCNIKIIDELLRKVIMRHLVGMQTNRESGKLPKPIASQTAEQMLRTVFREVDAAWDSDAKLVELNLALSPFLSYSVYARDSSMIHLTQQFEFSAAHRLHCNELSDEANRELFGKCNNLEGHGHNYVIEVTLSNEVDSDRGQVIALERFESTVKRLIIDRLDHKHLNRDTEYFSKTNPSVENIAIAIYGWLDGQFENAKLERVKVFETPKTWAEFCGE
ncbi:MAG: 6-pyruvoyl tetrahydropterin synthase family protein [Mariniblastus sp.]